MAITLDESLEPTSATLTFEGAVIGGDFVSNGGAFVNGVTEGVTGSLSRTTHSGKILITSGNVTVPNTVDDIGFNCILVAGGAHTVTFNSTTSAAMAAGDMMTLFVQSTTQIRAVLTAAADQIGFS